MSSITTRAYYGMKYLTASQFGGTDGPMVDGDKNGTGDFISDLSAIKAKNARVAFKFVGQSGTHKDSTGSYSFVSWKAMMDKAFNKIGADATSRASLAQQIGNFVQDGTLFFNYLIDDAQAGSTVFGTVPTFNEFESMASYSKSVWTTLPCAPRCSSTYLKQLAQAAGASNYTYIDFGWIQWHTRFGQAMTVFTNNVNDGRSVKIGTLCGFNLLNGGSGLTAPWNTHLSGNWYGMSPMELDACTAAFSANTYAIGITGWSADPNQDDTDYRHQPEIEASIQAMANVAAVRLAGPTNWRDISGSTSGSTQTVGGNWALVQVAGHKRGDGSGAFGIVYGDTPHAGNLLLLQAYSRDSIQRSLDTPSGWSLGKKFSGNSAQGGEGTLWYKLAAGDEANESLTWTGAGGTGAACMATIYEMSGNTSIMANLLSTTGSTRTWSAGSSAMGPVPGVQSAVSDALVLICAFKANDFTAQNLPDPATMSATTSGGETWQRCFISGTATGDDAGMFCDYAFLSGTPSITTKSWSQLTQAGLADSAVSGAGGGFMVTFRPGAVVAGTAPIITELTDVTLSLGSNLSFTMVSAGSTPITWSKVSGPSNVTIGASTGAFQFQPSSVGTYVLQVAASNSFGTDTEQFSVFAVAGSNVAPVIVNPGNQMVTAGDRLSFSVSATDADADPLTYTLESSPTGALIIGDTGQFSWIPTGEQGPGTYRVVVLVTDGQNESRSTFTVTVSDTEWTRIQTQPTNTFTRIR